MINCICRIGLVDQVIVLARRKLYAESSLGIEGYRSTKEKVNNQFVNNTVKFREKMKEFVTDKPSNIIFTEDLKNMAHLAETEEDVELVVTMVKKFHTQNKEMRFGNYIFGPVILRMFYHLEYPDLALQCLKDPVLEGFFDQVISFQILMDMLYEKQRYSDVLDVFELVQSRQLQAGKYPKHIVVLAFASCYKMNTKESFEYCKKLWQALKEVGHVPMRKAATFAAGLALLQNSPHIALEMLSTQRDQHYLTVRNLKAIAYAAMGRPEDALPILRSVLEVDSPTNTKRTFLRSVVQSVQDSIEQNGAKEIASDFKRIEKFLTEHDHISDKSLDEILCSEITSTSFSTQRNQNNSFIAATFRRTDRQHNVPDVKNRSRGREGLRDLY